MERAIHILFTYTVHCSFVTTIYVIWTSNCCHDFLNPATTSGKFKENCIVNASMHTGVVVIVWFITSYAISAYHHSLWAHIQLRRGVLDATIHYVIKCQWLAACQWFSPDTPASSTNKTDCHAWYNWNIVESGVKHPNPSMPTPVPSSQWQGKTSIIKGYS